MHDNLQAHLQEHGCQPKAKKPSRRLALALAMVLAVVIVPPNESSASLDPEPREP